VFALAIPSSFPHPGGAIRELVDAVMVLLALALALFGAMARAVVAGAGQDRPSFADRLRDALGLPTRKSRSDRRSRQRRRRRVRHVEAAMEAARLLAALRPILMTAFAFFSASCR